MSNNFDTGNRETSSVFPILKVILPIIIIIIILIKLFSNRGGIIDDPVEMTAEEIFNDGKNNTFLIYLGANGEFKFEVDIIINEERRPYIDSCRTNTILSSGTGFAVTMNDIITNKHVTTLDSDAVKSIHARVIVFLLKKLKDKYPNADIIPDTIKLNPVSFNRYLKIENPAYWEKGESLLIENEKDIHEASDCDLCWLHVDKEIPKLRSPLKINTEQFSTGERVIVLGYPGYSQDIAKLEDIFGKDDNKMSNIQLTFGEGSINKEKPIYNPKYGSCYEHSAPINKGNSGGPLINKFGEVIGINTWSYNLFVKDNIVDVRAAGAYFSVIIDEVRENFSDLWKIIINDYSPIVNQQNLE